MTTPSMSPATQPTVHFSSRRSLVRLGAGLLAGASLLAATACSSSSDDSNNTSMTPALSASCQSKADSFARAFAAQGDMTPKKFFCDIDPDHYTDSNAAAFPIEPSRFVGEPADPALATLAGNCEARANSLAKNGGTLEGRPTSILCDTDPGHYTDSSYVELPVNPAQAAHK